MPQLKKKRRHMLMLVQQDFNINEETLTIVEIKIRLKRIMRRHIGAANYISAFELFEEVFKVDPDNVQLYVKMAWWNIIKRLLSEMRKSEELFTVLDKTKVYVLQTKEESERLKLRVDREIAGLQDLKVRADKWVAEKKWRFI